MNKIYCLPILCLVFCGAVFAQVGKYREPWKNSARALVIDPYEGNPLDFEKLKQEQRVAGIIHKATDFKYSKKLKKRVLSLDAMYLERRDKAKKRGYLWGSYHLGRAGDPILQADYYLAQTQPAEDEVMALDLEDTIAEYMSISNALIFIRRVKEKTGRYPMLYLTNKVRLAILNKYGSAVPEEFTKSPMWYARYCRDITNVFEAAPPTQPKIWSSYTLWQFASEINCPTKNPDAKNCPKMENKRCPLSAPIAGTDYKMDVNVFDGTVEQLRSRWRNIGREE